MEATLTISPHASSGKIPTTHKLQVPSAQPEAAAGAKTPVHYLCSQVIQLITT